MANLEREILRFGLNERGVLFTRENARLVQEALGGDFKTGFSPGYYVYNLENEWGRLAMENLYGDRPMSRLVLSSGTASLGYNIFMEDVNVLEINRPSSFVSFEIRQASRFNYPTSSGLLSIGRSGLIGIRMRRPGSLE